MIIKCIKPCVRAGLKMLNPGSLHEVTYFVGVDLVKSGFAQEATIEEFIRDNYRLNQQPIKEDVEPARETKVLTAKEKRRANRPQ